VVEVDVTGDPVSVIQIVTDETGQQTAVKMASARTGGSIRFISATN
jgi:hypothetical protein